MDTAFALIDESSCVETDTFSMTAVLMETRHYHALRELFHKFVSGLHPTASNAINLHPHSLHGCNLLRGDGFEWVTDEMRISCFHFACAMIRDFNLPVYRWGLGWNNQKRRFPCDASFLRSMLFLRILLMFEHQLEHNFIIPVIDGLNADMWKGVSGSVQATHSIATTARPICGIKSVENLCEPLFAPSSFSPLIQLVDLVSYMLHVKDWRDCDLQMGEYKQKVWVEACNLPDDIPNVIVKEYFQ
jgi:hypothetical protein